MSEWADIRDKDGVLTGCERRYDNDYKARVTFYNGRDGYSRFHAVLKDYDGVNVFDMSTTLTMPYCQFILDMVAMDGQLFGMEGPLWQCYSRSVS